MRLLFFGDSFTEGEGSTNKCSFTHFLKDIYNISVWNFGISGTTIGEYSIYPVDGNSLLSNISKYKVFIENCDVLYLEYGINDMSAIMCDFTTLKIVEVSFVKALDAIKQINPSIKIIFLSISDKPCIVDMYANLQCKYLMDDYFKGYNFYIEHKDWSDNYKKLVEFIERRCYVVPMVTDMNFFDNMSNDLIHPNNEGYSMISKNILRYM